MNASPEALLHTVLARIGAVVGPGTRVDTVIEQPASLNVIAAIIGAPGTGKGRAIRHGASLLPFQGTEVEEIGLTTGEGLIEAYMGVDEFTQQRVQTRDRLFAATTEAEVLAQCVSRSGNTLRAHLCSAWMGEALITTTADPERRRKILADQYRFAAVMAAQPDVADLFLAGDYLGLPQRMAWAPGTRSPGFRVPRRDRPEWPGELPGPDDTTLAMWLNDLPETSLVLPDEAVDELDAIAEALEEGRGAEHPLDTHEPLWRAKYTALLTLLDGDTEITVEHWNLAGQLWEASCSQRDDLIASARVREQTKQASADAARVRTSTRITRMNLMMSDGIKPVLLKVAKKMARKVMRAEGPLKTEQVNSAVGSQDRKNATRDDVTNLTAASREVAVSFGWIDMLPNGEWIVGPTPFLEDES